MWGEDRLERDDPRVTGVEGVFKQIPATSIGPTRCLVGESPRVLVEEVIDQCGDLRRMGYS